MDILVQKLNEPMPTWYLLVLVAFLVVLNGIRYARRYGVNFSLDVYEKEQPKKKPGSHVVHS